jgi:hypothetical protein
MAGVKTTTTVATTAPSRATSVLLWCKPTFSQRSKWSCIDIVTWFIFFVAHLRSNRSPWVTGYHDTHYFQAGAQAGTFCLDHGPCGVIPWQDVASGLWLVTEREAMNVSCELSSTLSNLVSWCIYCTILMCIACEIVYPKMRVPRALWTFCGIALLLLTASVPIMWRLLCQPDWLSRNAQHQYFPVVQAHPYWYVVLFGNLAYAIYMIGIRSRAMTTK